MSDFIKELRDIAESIKQCRLTGLTDYLGDRHWKEILKAADALEAKDAEIERLAEELRFANAQIMCDNAAISQWRSIWKYLKLENERLRTELDVLKQSKGGYTHPMDIELEKRINQAALVTEAKDAEIEQKQELLEDFQEKSTALTSSEREEIENIRRTIERGLRLAQFTCYERGGVRSEDFLDIFQHLLNLVTPLTSKEKSNEPHV